MPRATSCVCLTIVAAFQVHLGAAAAVSEDVPLPGGTLAMAQSLGLPLPPERARFVAEMARLLYPATDINRTRAKITSTWGGARGKTKNAPEVLAEAVPIPLTATAWSRAVFRRIVPPEEIVVAILSDSRAAHLSHGLAGNDDETLQFFLDHPRLITWLYENAAAAFAAFASSLHIRENRVVLPGGAAATAVWQAVVGESPDDPDAFVRALFGQDQGRLAYLYDTISELDAARAAFALGLWMKDPAVRADRFKALVAAHRGTFPQWQPAKFPFAKPVYDMASLLGRVQAEPEGSPSSPSARSAWRWAFESSEVPAGAPDLALQPDEGLIDAAWLAQNLTTEDADARADRLDQLAFGQRAFRRAGAAELPESFVAIRAFPRYRMLMLTLEQIGVRHASVYATAARRAQQLSSLDGRRGSVALGQFQGALVLVARMAIASTLDAAACEKLVLGLSSISPADGRYAGALAAWMRRDLGAALASVKAQPESNMEGALALALAGAHTAKAAASRVSWEGQIYRLDLAAAEAQRLRRIRERQGGPTTDVALTLAEIAATLSASRVALGDLAGLTASLKMVAADLPSGGGGPPHLEAVNHAIRELAKVADRTDPRLAHLAAPLADVADELLADALIGWAYAISIADADSPLLLTPDIPRRHDFGLNAVLHRPRPQLEWALPRRRIAVGAPWHVAGSLLGLDVALSSLALRRVDGDRVVDAPSLSTNEREAFAQAVSLLNPWTLHDRERDAMAEAVERGRRRVEALVGDGGALDAVTAEIRMDGWRRRALQWTIAHDPERIGSYFSLTEMLLLGRPAPASLDAWGMSAIVSSGCLCTRLAPPNQWRLLLGRPQLGLLAASVPDLNIHIAMMLRELGLPAAVAKSVLTAAVQDFIDEVRPTDVNDWLTLVRAARTVPRQRVEDYVAAVTADGPLVPEDAADPFDRP